ncbi:hypothetical protein ACJIZ3_017295 [Penstemon smallii]|uniref:Carboxypeptidase n=1 Tax=Penstemon smallii TaxID=265156 RepID=A0ABD3SWA4_9LAMI
MRKMASFFYFSLSLLLLFLFSSPTSSLAETKDDSLFMTSSSELIFPKTQAENLIRALNLFPKHEANHHASNEYNFGASRIVEKEFKFPLLGNSGASVQDLGHHAGYYKLQHTKDARMFYFFFESRNSKTDPVVIWLTGGPGCSSELALFYENGPFHITSNLSLAWNDFGWDKVSNLIYVDQPIGTGFSYSSDDDDIRHNEEGVSNDLYDFLQAFFKEHPQYVKNDFYITGESYAGHYIPAFASRVHQGNKNKEGLHINLKGFAIGNGLTNPEIQYKAYTDYALDNKLITQSDYKRISKTVTRCEQAIKLCGADDGGSSCVAAYMVCNNIFNSIVRISGGINYYDIRKKCEGDLCYDFSNMENFLKQKHVREALGVGDIDFVSCSSTVYEAMVKDLMRNLEVGIPTLLEDGIKNDANFFLLSFFPCPFLIPKNQAEKLIRSLNLFPKLDVNIVEGDSTVIAPKIVEKSFQFPDLGDSINAADSNGTSIQDLGHHAGYYSLPHTKGARMFYFFFESRNKRSTDPVVIWLTGGPGCSGSLALFYENGPFHLTNDSSLVWNEFGWDLESNLIYVDQPTGTGFSYSSNRDDIRSSSEEAGVDFADFLQAFFEKHPQYAKNDFYITGESYAGHYIPAFAAEVQQRNKNKQGIYINLKGLAIGNGLTNPGIQYNAYTDYALQMKLIDKTTYDDLSQYVSTCQSEIKDCGSNGSSACFEAYRDCNQVFNELVSVLGNINYYDVRKECVGSLCYDFSNAENFLNDKSVKKALGVEGDIAFISCSTTVYDAMTGDWVKNFEVGIPSLLRDGVKLLIYAGEYDLICNWLGNSRWVDSMEWYGRRQFLSALTVPFTVDGVEAGLQKSYGPLTFLKVHDAGHLVPMDQPKASLEMLRRWMQGKPL